MKIFVAVSILLCLSTSTKHVQSKKVTAKTVIEAVVRTGGDMQAVLEQLDEYFLTPITKEMDAMLKRVNTEIEGITEEEKKLVSVARSALRASRLDITRTRAVLVALAAETSTSAADIVLGLKKFLADQDNQSKRNSLAKVVKKMEKILKTSQTLLKRARQKYEGAAKQLNLVRVKFERFSERMVILADRSSTRYNDYVAWIRKVVYGSTASCWILPPSCIVAYATAAGILETKICNWNAEIDELKDECYESKKSADNLVNKVNKDLGNLEREDTNLMSWQSNIALVYEDFASGGYLDVAADMDYFIPNYAVNKMNSLKDVADGFMKKSQSVVE